MAADMPGVTPMDVVFSFDTTGSMSQALDEVKARVTDIIQKLQADIPGVRVGIIAHGDYCDAEHFYDIKSLDLSDNVADVVTFVNETGGTGGGDFPECYELALRQAKNMNWRPVGLRILVVIGDSYPHEPDYELNVDQVNWRTELNELAAMNVHIYGVQVQHNEDSTQFFNKLATTTEGQHLQLENMGRVCEVIMGICYREQGPIMFKNFEEEIRHKESNKLDKDLECVFGTLRHEVSRTSDITAILDRDDNEADTDNDIGDDEDDEDDVVKGNKRPKLKCLDSSCSQGSGKHQLKQLRFSEIFKDSSDSENENDASDNDDEEDEEEENGVGMRRSTRLRRKRKKNNEPAKRNGNSKQKSRRRIRNNEEMDQQLKSKSNEDMEVDDDNNVPAISDPADNVVETNDDVGSDDDDDDDVVKGNRRPKLRCLDSVSIQGIGKQLLNKLQLSDSDSCDENVYDRDDEEGKCDANNVKDCDKSKIHDFNFDSDDDDDDFSSEGLTSSRGSSESEDNGPFDVINDIFGSSSDDSSDDDDGSRGDDNDDSPSAPVAKKRKTTPKDAAQNNKKQSRGPRTSPYRERVVSTRFKHKKLNWSPWHLAACPEGKMKRLWMKNSQWRNVIPARGGRTYSLWRTDLLWSIPATRGCAMMFELSISSPKRHGRSVVSYHITKRVPGSGRDVFRLPWYRSIFLNVRPMINKAASENCKLFVRWARVTSKDMKKCQSVGNDYSYAWKAQPPRPCF